MEIYAPPRPTGRILLVQYSDNNFKYFYFFQQFLISSSLIKLDEDSFRLQSSFFHFLAIEYGLAMSSTAVAVLLGCAVEDPKMATEFLPLLFVPQLLFAGFFVRTELIPAWLRWAQYLCSLTYGVRLALLAEFGK